MSGDIEQRIIDLLGAVGGVGVILVALVVWLGGVWKDILSIRATARNNLQLEEQRKKYAEELETLKNKFNFELENMRNTFAERQRTVDRTLDLLSTSIPASHERVLSAVDLLWHETLKVRTQSRDAFLVYSIMLKEEIESEKAPDAINAITQLDLKKFSENLDLSEVERSRPYVGEKLWLLFFIYQAFSRRLMLKLLERKERRKFYYWEKGLDGKPEDIFAQLRPAISDEEAKEIMRLPEFQVVDAIRRAIESKIIVEINELVFGHKLTQIGIEEQRQLFEVTRRLELDLKTVINN